MLTIWFSSFFTTPALKFQISGCVCFFLHIFSVIFVAFDFSKLFLVVFFLLFVCVCLLSSSLLLLLLHLMWFLLLKSDYIDSTSCCAVQFIPSSPVPIVIVVVSFFSSLASSSSALVIFALVHCMCDSFHTTFNTLQLSRFLIFFCYNLWDKYCL